MNKIFTSMMLLLVACLYAPKAFAEDVLPEEGKTYYIKNDNYNASGTDQDYYLYDNSSSLSLSAVKDGEAYRWICEKEGDYFRFKNKATNKYLAHKELSDQAYNFTIDPTQKINEGCLPLFSVNANRYLLVKKGGAGFDQADRNFNKTEGFSGDYIFEEYKEDVLPEEDKTYYIKSDNVNASGTDEDYYLYDNGSLGLSTNRGREAYQWICEKEGDYFRFKNKSTNKYLAHKGLSDQAYNFTIDPTQKINEGCLPLFSVDANRYMVVKKGGQQFDQTQDPYNKETQGYSSDYIFEEFGEGDRMLTIVTEPSIAQPTFSLNGESYKGACTFILKANTETTEATLTADCSQIKEYSFLGFYEDGTYLGESIPISEVQSDRTITAKFDYTFFSESYGEKWVRINWSQDANYMMGLPANNEGYENVAPRTIQTSLYSSNQMWCFVGTAEDFKLYNKASGETLALSTENSGTTSGTATHMTSAEGATSWHLIATSHGLAIAPLDSDLGLNSFGGAGGDIKLYDNSVSGSNWIPTYIVMPFKFSDAPKDGKFAENTTWYNLTLRNKYASYVNEQDYISITSEKLDSYGDFWAFVETEKGTVEIYNAATGANKVLASEGGEGETYPIMVDKNNLGDNRTGAWHIKPGNNLFYLKKEGETNEFYLNDMQGILATWENGNSATDGGSQFRVSEITNVEELINTARSNQEAVTGAVGTLISDSYAQFQAALEKGTVEGLAEALMIRDAIGETVPFDVNKQYYLFAYKSESSTKYLGINNSAELYSTNLSTNSASVLWKFAGDDTEGYTISSQGTYLGKQTTDSNPIPTTTQEEAARYKLNAVPNKAAAFSIRPEDARGLHIDASGNVVGWNSGGGSEWYLISAPTIELTISGAGYATVNYPFAVQMPQGLTAYTGKAEMAGETGVLNLTEVPAGAVPANTPVILQGDAGTYELTIISENAPESIETTSDLYGTLLPKTIDASTNAYILSKTDNEGVGFYLLDPSEENRTIGVNKAYMVPSSLPANIKSFSIAYDDETTTGIEDTVTEGAAQEEYYDLQGRRVMNPTKGIYVTKSGKKVLICK